MRMEALSSSSSSGTAGAACTTGQKGDERHGGKTERKVVHNASSKVSLVVQKMLFPLLDTPMRSHVVFDVEREQAELDLLDQLGRNKPEVLEDSRTFVQHLQGLFDRYKQGFSVHGGAYSRVSTHSPCASGLHEPLCTRVTSASPR